ncbi:MAG: penicillin-binding protein 2 [Chloroflexi bacterium]|nr:penicillin-binding protein 2 [Chloroflexota bacterium]
MTRKTGIEPITSLEDAVDVDEREREPFQGRLLAFKIATVIVFAILIRQLWWLQIVRGEEYRERADNNRFRLMSIEAPRGVIYDRNKILLVRNTPSYAVTIIPADLPKEADMVFERLGKVLEIPQARIRELVEPAPKGKRTTDSFTPVQIKSGVSWEVAYAVEERHLELTGVHVQIQPVREYLDGPLTSQILGYVGQISGEQYEKYQDDREKKYTINDRIGQMGMELTLEHELRGTPGERHMEVDSTGREVDALFVQNPIPGHNVRLTIDIALQREIARILQNHLVEVGGSATAIAMDPRNGQVLAMVSLPSYDNNMFSREISSAELNALLNDPLRPLINHAISDVNAPGSTFKIVVASGALQERVVDKYTKVYCPGYILIPNPFGGVAARMNCWAAHGIQDMISGLANSCDVYFYTLGGGPTDGKWQGLGTERMAKYSRLYGFGARTGIDLPGETTGLIPNEEWKKVTVGEPWYKGDTYNMAIGQGYVTVTPIQLMNAYVALANGGTLFKPRVVAEITDAEGNVVKSFAPEVIRQLPVDPQYLATVRDGLRAGMLIGKTDNGTSYVGTSYDSEVPGLRIAGKTGTAQYGEPDEKGDLPTHGWFGAFAPTEAPEIATLVFINKGGGKVSANITAEIMRAYFHVPETGTR